MQEDVNQRTLALAIQSGKVTARTLKAAMRNALKTLDQPRQTRKQVKAAEKSGMARERGKEKERVRLEKQKPHGKQTIKKLTAQGMELSNIEITDNNIKSFDRVARKYGIDYSLMRDNSITPPRYLVFFKAKDVSVMTQAFKEYAGVSMKKTKKPSVRKKLQKTIQKTKAKHRIREKIKQKTRGQER